MNAFQNHFQKTIKRTERATLGAQSLLDLFT